MTLPSITLRQGPRCLYRAQNVSDLMAAALPYCSSQTQAWCLLWPGVAAKQFMFWKGNREMVDENVAEEIARFQLPTHSQPLVPQTSTERGGDRLVEALARQFPFVASTQLMAVVQSQGTPIALVGMAGTVRPTYGKMVLLEIVTALENLAEIENLRLEADMYRLLASRHEEALVVAAESGQIRGATPSGWKSLSALQNGEQGAVTKQSEWTMPAEIVSAVGAGERPTCHGILVLGKNLAAGELVENLVIYEFHQTSSEEYVKLEEAAKRLTPTQTEVLRLLVRGLHYKEIAARLGNSVHTIHHHVSAILTRLNSSDKLELVAKMRTKGKTASRPRKHRVAPSLSDAPAVTDLPRPDCRTISVPKSRERKGTL